MKHIIFDAFGTLFKVDVPMQELEILIPGKADKMIDSYRTNLLESTWVSTLANTYYPFDKLSKMALSNAFLKHQVENEEAFQLLLKIYDHPIPFEEGEEALVAFSQKDYAMHILSNGTQKMLENAMRECQWEDYFDSIHSVESVKRYKPDPIVYQMACEAIPTTTEETLFISSNAWDIFGAGQFGFTTAWINRAKFAAFPYQSFIPTYNVSEITELIDLI